jgi:hypothetical protein
MNLAKLRSFLIVYTSHSQDHFLKNIYLIPTKPLGGCSRLQNRFELKGNIAFIERGYA